MDTLTLRGATDAIIEVGRRIWVQGFAAANDGNLSIRLSEDRILATATGSIKGFLTGADLVVIDRNGSVMEGSRRVTSEIQMHLAIYDARSDVRAVAHAHPPTATGFATAGVPLDLCVLPEIVATLGTLPYSHQVFPLVIRFLSTDLMPSAGCHPTLIISGVYECRSIYRVYYRPREFPKRSLGMIKVLWLIRPATGRCITRYLQTFSLAPGRSIPRYGTYGRPAEINLLPARQNLP